MSHVSDHVAAVAGVKQAGEMTVARQTANLSKSEAAVTSAMKNVYFAAKENLATTIVPELNALCIEQVCTTLYLLY